MAQSKEAKPTLEDFPIEVIESISSYLSIYDINSCCVCNSRMREMFNDDLIWKKRCDRYLAEYLEQTPCNVEPKFSVVPLLEKTNHSLSPVSKWKIAVMRETHLWNNWRKGNYVEEEIKNSETESNYNCDFHTFLSDDFIIAIFKNRFEVLDVRQFPALLLANVDCYGTRKEGFKLNLWHNSVICSVGSAVQVFQLDTQTNECKLKHLFYFEDDAQVEQTDLTKDEVKVFIESNKTKPMLHVQMADSVLVGVYKNESIIHIWNIETGQKIKKVEPLMRNCQISDIAFSSTKDIIICFSEKSSQSEKCCVVYSLCSLKYLKFHEKVPKSSVISVYKNFVAFWDQNEKSIKIFDYDLSRQIMCTTSVSQPARFRNGFIFNVGEALACVNVSTETVQILNNQGESVLWFEVLSNKFIQVTVSQNYSNQVWEISNDLKTVKTTSLNLHFNMCAYFFNKSRTRYIVRFGVGNVLHFW